MKLNLNKWLVSGVIILGLLLGAGFVRAYVSVAHVLQSHVLADEADPADCPPDVVCARIHIPVS